VTDEELEQERKWTKLLADSEFQKALKDFVEAFVEAFMGKERPCRFCGELHRDKPSLSLWIHERDCLLRPRFYALRVCLSRIRSIFRRRQ
jgi:hypothetical protein